MVTKEDIYRKLISKRKEKIDDFDTKVLTSILLKKFFETKEYEFYFTPKIKLEADERIKTPDYLAKKNEKVDIVGEIKQSLPDINKDYFQATIEKYIKQLKDYISNFIEISSPHDVFIASPQRCNEAISKLIEEIEKEEDLKNNLLILKYYWNSGTSHRSLVLSKIYGTFSDEEVENELKNGKDFMMGERDLNETQGSYKIFYTEEELSAPIEYVMAILWFNVFPELSRSSEKDRALERIKKGSNTFEFTLDEIWQILKKYYILNSFPSSDLNQFNKKMLIKAMESFRKIDKAKITIKEGSSEEEKKYAITFTKFNTKRDLIDFFIEELNREEYSRVAEIEYNKLSNQPLPD